MFQEGGGLTAVYMLCSEGYKNLQKNEEESAYSTNLTFRKVISEHFFPGACEYERDSANAVPTNKNCAFELSTFGIIVGVSRTEVQWNSLTLEERPS